MLESPVEKARVRSSCTSYGVTRYLSQKYITREKLDQWLYLMYVARIRRRQFVYRRNMYRSIYVVFFGRVFNECGLHPPRPLPPPPPPSVVSSNGEGVVGDAEVDEHKNALLRGALKVEEAMVGEVC